jgi:hypothetical protein
VSGHTGTNLERNMAEAAARQAAAVALHARALAALAREMLVDDGGGDAFSSRWIMSLNTVFSTIQTHD